MVPIMAFLQEKLLLTQPSQDLALLVRAQRMPGPHPAACGAQGSVAHVTLQPVCERQHHQLIQDPETGGKGL